MKYPKLYPTYNSSQVFGHNELDNRFKIPGVKYVVYNDGINIIYFTRGNFDNFCVQWLKNGEKQKLEDIDYFAPLQQLGYHYGNDIVWHDWDTFALKMISNTRDLIKEAERLNYIYPNTKILWIIFGLVMYAEDIRKQKYNNNFVFLKRNVKRFAAFNILQDGYSLEKTVKLTVDVRWKIIKDWMIDRDIYVDLENYPTSMWDSIYDKVHYY